MLKTIQPQLFLLAAIYIIVLVLIFLDLWSGVRKAKRAGQYRSSFGLRETVKKMASYFNMLLAVTCIDALQGLAVHTLADRVNLPLFPFFTLGAAIFVGVIEVKSMLEKTEQKERAKLAEATKLVQQLLKDRSVESVLAKLAEVIKSAENAKEE